MKRRAAAAKWESEAALCSSFAAAARAGGWTVYPETSGADLLLVAGPDVGKPFKPGDQVSVQAKLQVSVGLVRQALPPRPPMPSADFYVVVTPKLGSVADLRMVCIRLGIGLCSAAPVRTSRWEAGIPMFTEDFGVRGSSRRWPRVERTAARLWVPDVVVDTPAGVPAPTSVTPWKLAAVRLCVSGQTTLTSADFKAAGIGIRRFIDNGWIELVGKRGRLNTYKLTDARDRPDRAYPEIAAALAKN